MLVRTFAVALLVAAASNAFAQRRCAVRVDTASILSGRSLDEFMTLLQTEEFEVSRSKKDIPPFISEQMQCLATDNFALANPNENYNCCCTTSAALPRRQLQLIAKSKNAFVLVYRIGLGKVAPTSLTIFRRKKDGSIDLWTGYGSSRATSVPDLLAYMQEHREKGFLLLKDAIGF
jgi:hypothetical protein